ncbi:MAG: CoA transferase [SAR202 cluster bacterium]|nr:CoA transferase [SAR202 cluster bacterium]
MEPLRDLRVLGVTVFLAGPFLSMTLARLGAEVIKVEAPGRGDPVRGNGPFVGPQGTHAARKTEQDLSTRFLKRTQGVKSITLDLKHPQGGQMFLELARHSDVVIENLAPGSMKRMGLGYQEVAAANPGIVYCSISGYGQEGPYAAKPAHDPQIQGMSGLMDINGDTDGPPTRVGFYIGDLVTPMFAAYSILAALRQKERTGQGQYLDVSMMDTLVSLMFMENLEESLEEGLPLRMGNNVRGGPTGLYHTTDGDIIVTATSDDQWRRFCTALGGAELLEDRRFATYRDRGVNVAACRAEMQRLIGQCTRQEALERLERHDVPCGPVRTAAEVVADQHFWQRGTLRKLAHGSMDAPVPGVGSGFPVLFSGGLLPGLAGAPTLGMHNQEIYGGLLGLTSQELAQLKEQRVV